MRPGVLLLGAWAWTMFRLLGHGPGSALFGAFLTTLFVAALFGGAD